MQLATLLWRFLKRNWEVQTNEDIRWEVQTNEDIRSESMNGVLIIDKPSGMTSHDVVNRVRRIAQERSVGHLGTLDPMATGVLPLVLGKMTRLAQFYLHTEKRYEGTICLGF